MTELRVNRILRGIDVRPYGWGRVAILIGGSDNAKVVGVGSVDQLSMVHRDARCENVYRAVKPADDGKYRVFKLEDTLCW